MKTNFCEWLFDRYFFYKIYFIYAICSYDVVWTSLNHIPNDWVKEKIVLKKLDRSKSVDGRTISVDSNSGGYTNLWLWNKASLEEMLRIAIDLKIKFVTWRCFVKNTASTETVKFFPRKNDKRVFLQCALVSRFPCIDLCRFAWIKHFNKNRCESDENLDDEPNKVEHT